MNISAIILAAGKGERMGQPKWQLTHDGKSFLEIIVAKLLDCGIDDIVCVLRETTIVPELIAAQSKIAINPEPDIGMISSVYYGVQSAQDRDGYLIFPVDHPFVAKATITKLCEVFSQQQNAVVCPSYHGRAGHPIVIPINIAKNLTPKDFANNLRQFLRVQQCNVVKVEVDDEAVLKNINFREDLTGVQI